MIKPETDTIIDFLNEIARLDPAFMRALVNTRVPCNEAILDHPTIQAGYAKDWPSEITNSLDPSQGVAGFLGVINGYCGAYDNGPKKGWGPVTAMIDDDGAISFCLTESRTDGRQ